MGELLTALCFRLSAPAAEADSVEGRCVIIPAPNAGGWFPGDDGQAWRNPDPQGLVAAFNGVRPIDVNHAEDLKAKAGDAASAYGWIEEIRATNAGAIEGRLAAREIMPSLGGTDGNGDATPGIIGDAIIDEDNPPPVFGLAQPQRVAGMSGALVVIEGADLRRFQRQLDRLIDIQPRRALEQAAGAVAGQTRDRILHEHAGQAGEICAARSKSYAQARHGGQSLRQSGDDKDAGGGLPDAIAVGSVTDDRAEVGTNRIYGATPPFSDDERGTLARPYLAVSPVNRADIERPLQNWAEGVVNG